MHMYIYVHRMCVEFSATPKESSSSCEAARCWQECVSSEVAGKCVFLLGFLIVNWQNHEQNTTSPVLFTFFAVLDDVGMLVGGKWKFVHVWTILSII